MAPSARMPSFCSSSKIVIILTLALFVHASQAAEISSEAMPADGLGSVTPGTCSCYIRRAGIFGDFWKGGTCVCQSVCIYGQVMALSGKYCRDSAKESQESVLESVPCSNETSFQDALSTAKNEVTRQFGRVKTRSREWLAERKSITWLNGTTVLLLLDVSATNVYHLVSKTMPLTWLPSVGVKVDRVLTDRTKKFMRTIRKTGEDSEIGIILEASLNYVLGLSPQNNSVEDCVTVDKLRRLFQTPTANNRLLFESNLDVSRATESDPLCFESLVLPGVAHGSLYQEGPKMAQKYQSLIGASLRNEFFKPARRGVRHPNLLYVKRTSGANKRGFIHIADKKVIRLLQKTKLPLKIFDFSWIPFPEQVKLVQWADIIFGVHGANLLNPSLFMRKGVILIELFPWHFLWNGYGNSSMALGGVYMGYMLQRERSLPLTDLTVTDCLTSPSCLRKYRDVRLMTITRRDLKEIYRMVLRAKKLAIDLMSSYSKAINAKEWNVDDRLMAKNFPFCEIYDRDKKMLWVGYYSVKQDTVKLCSLLATTMGTKH